MKRLLLTLMCCLLALGLCSCASSGVPLSTDAPQLTLPPATTAYVAPIGDAALEYTASTTLYLPRHDGARLGAVISDVTYSYARPMAESVARALLNYPGNGAVSAIGGDVRLSLYGVSPVEQSGSVATVNLSATALQLDRHAFYLACQAIANTLCELPQINYVNVLVMDKSVGLDIAGALPMGTLSRSLQSDVAAAYEQLLTRRVSAQDDAAEQTLSSNVTLYFPLTAASGFMSEVRACGFASQRAEDMVMTLLRELGEGPRQGLRSPALPLLADLLESPPAIADEAGGRVISLDFGYNLDDMLELNGLTRAQTLSALCYTLCTYLPNISGLRVSVGGTPVDTLMLTDAFDSSVTFDQGLMTRSDFASLLYDDCTLYFTDGQKLVSTLRPIPYAQRQSPRQLLIELGKGPQAGDSVQGLQPVMAKEAIRDADILGLAGSEHTLLVNLAPTLEGLGDGLSAKEERWLAYAMVNTLCEDERLKSVCFFLSGSQWDSFTGEIYWGGLFLPME